MANAAMAETQAHMAVAQYFVVCHLNFFNAVGLAVVPIVDAHFISAADHTNLQVRSRTTELELVRPCICELQAIDISCTWFFIHLVKNVWLLKIDPFLNSNSPYIFFNFSLFRWVCIFPLLWCICHCLFFLERIPFREPVLIFLFFQIEWEDYLLL